MFNGGNMAINTESSVLSSGLKIKKITPKYSTAGQLTPADVAEIRALGYQSVVCNRPDFEGGQDQPTADSVGGAAAGEGITFRYLPVSPGDVTDEDAEDLRALLDELPGPVLAYCLSGARSTEVFLLSELV